MKAVRKFTIEGKTVFRLSEAPEPEIHNADDVKIKVEAVGVCASDIHALHGAMSVPEGNIVGHEFAGTVVETGAGVTDFAPGDGVVSELAIGRCGECDMCRAGHYEFCRRKQPQGWASPGVYAEYTLSDAGILHRIPGGVGFAQASLTEPIAICVFGCLERARIKPTDSVVIYGMGSIGLLTLVVLLDHGVRDLICVTPTRHGRGRFDLAENLGAPVVLTPDDDIAKAVEDRTGRPAPDCVVECSGAAAAINDGMQLLRKDGTFVGLGIASEDEIPFRYNTGVLSAIHLVFSSTSSRSSWTTSLGILERRGDSIDKIITHKLKLDDWEKAYDLLENRQAVKAVLIP